MAGASFRPYHARWSRGLDGHLIDLPRLKAPTTSKNAPGDASQFIGERNRKHVAVQPLLGSLDPWLEPMAFPALGFDQHDPCRLHEQNSQVAIAALGYPAEDRAVSGRHLFRDEPKPGGEVAAFGERIPSTDRSHHRA